MAAAAELQMRRVRRPGQLRPAVLLDLGLALVASLEAAIPATAGWRIELPDSGSGIVSAPGRERVLQRRARPDPDLAEDGGGHRARRAAVRGDRVGRRARPQAPAPSCRPCLTLPGPGRWPAGQSP